MHLLWQLQIMMNFLILIVHHEILNPKLITCRLQSLLDEEKNGREEIEVRDLRELNVKNDFLFRQFKINEMMMHTDILCVVTGAYYTIHQGLSLSPCLSSGM